MPNDYITQIKDTNGVTYDIRDPSKQDLLVSGTNIKTVNNTSLLGSGNINIQGGGSAFIIEPEVTLYDDLLDAINDERSLIVSENGWWNVSDWSVNDSTNTIQFTTTVSFYDAGHTLATMTYQVNYQNNWAVNFSYDTYQPELVSGTNIKTINNTSLLGSGDITVTVEPEVFTCVYGTTTFADAVDAYDDGKTLICDDGTGLLLLFKKTSTQFEFVRTSETSFVKCVLTNSSPYWSITNSSPYATPTASKVAKFDSNAHMKSTDMSAQDVSDFVDGLNPQKVLKTVETKTLLWTNTNPTSAFSSQTVTVGTSYDAYEIVYTGYTGQADIKKTERLDESQGILSFITGASGHTSGNLYIFKRQVWKDANGVGFGNLYSTTGSGSWATYSSNTGIVPYKIYGLKTEQL